MTALRELLGRLLNLLRARRVERDLDREIAAHLRLLEERYARRGLTPEQARRAARRALGGVDQTKEIHREQRAFPRLEQVGRDLAYAARLLYKAPGFTAVATLTLALGIGASTAVFTQVNAIFLKPLPVDRPGDLRILSWASARRPFAGPRLTQRIWDQWISEGVHIETFSYAAYRSLIDNDSGFRSVACWRRGTANSPALPSLTVQYVSPNYFETVRAGALVGRVLGSADETMGSEIPAAISHSFWQRVFRGAGDVIGKRLDLEQGRFVVVGVMPKGFFGVALAFAPDLFVPLAAAPPRNPDDWGGCNVIARLGPGVDEELARARAETLVGQSIQSKPPRDPYDLPRVWLSNAEHGDDDLRRATSSSLGLLMATTSLVFLIACANVAGLLIARGAGRAREIATRMAVGASRGRIVQQLLTESLLISMLGATAGIVLAYAFMPALPRLLLQFVGRDALGVDLSPDLRVLAFAVGLASVNGVLFGLLPAIQGALTRRESLATLGAPTGARFTSGKLLVAAQVALSLILLVAAGLCIRSLINLRAVPLGYDPSGLVFVTLNATPQQTGYVRTTLDEMRALPQVRAATASQYPLFGAAERSLPFCVPGFMPTDRDDRFVDGDQIAPGYFETWGVKLLAGRDFTWDDARRRHVIVNAAFAAKYFAGRNALGQTIGIGPKCTGVELTIIGVVADSTNVPRDTGRPMIYAPYRQNVGFATFALRVDDAERFVPVLRALLIDRASSLRGDIRTGVAYRDRELAYERLVTAFLVAFGATAMLLSCIGLYGALAFLVSRRTAEIGVRMALGAARPAVVRLVMIESVTPVMLGLLAGGAASLAATRAVERVLFGVSRNDPLVASAAMLLFVIIAALASAAPAMRAARIDPARTLRHD